MKQFSILTFNIRYGHAFNELVELIEKYKPDLVCVQEFRITEDEVAKLEETGLELADYSYSFFKFFYFFSVATFYNPKKLKHLNSEAVSLARGAYETFLFILRLGRTERTALNNQFKLKGEKTTFNICNVHLTPLYGTNKVRTKQLKKTLVYVDNHEPLPSIILGDFNYPYRRRDLEAIFRNTKFKEATNNVLYTYEHRWFGLIKAKVKLDYIWYRGMKRESCERLERKISDHYPVLSTFSI